MSFVLAVVVIVAFAVVIERLDLTARGQEAGRRASDCIAILRDASLSDDDKERMLQDHAFRLFGLIGILGGGAAIGLAIPLGAIWLLELAGLASLADVLEVLQRLDFLLGTTLAVFLGYLVFRYLAGT